MKQNRYQKAMQDVCDKHLTLTAEEMLAKAKASAGTERTITMKKSTKKSIIYKIIGISAACAVISGTAVTALGYGPLGESFRKFFGIDKTTEEIIDQGHYAEIGQEQSDGAFTVKLVSVTGDEMNPKLFFDVTVNSETLAANNDTLRLFAYILDEDNYQNHLEDYGMWDGVGTKDPEIGNLYHVCMNGASAFMVNQQEVIAAVKQIQFENDPEREQYEYAVNMEYRFKVPEIALKESCQAYYEDITISSGELNYDLMYADFGAYESMLTFNYDFLGTSLAGGVTNYDDVSEQFDAYWHDFAKDFILTVDGTDYAPQELGYSYCVNDSDAIGAGRCSTWLSFPGIDYANAELITLTAGGQTYTLKDGKEEEYVNDVGDFLQTDEFSDITLSSDNVDYALYMTEYYTNETDLLFKYDFRNSPLAGGETDYHNYHAIAGAFDADWEAFAGNFVLTVDGTAYTPSSMGCSYAAQEGDYLEPGMCSTSIYFPGIDYENATKITLTAGDVTVILKGEDAETVTAPVPENAEEASVQETAAPEAQSEDTPEESAQETEAPEDESENAESANEV